MTNKVYTLNAQIEPYELTAEEFRFLAKRGLRLLCNNTTYYYQYNPRHVYPGWTHVGYRQSNSWSRNSSYMAPFDFHVVYRQGGTVVQTPNPPRISRSKPCIQATSSL